VPFEWVATDTVYGVGRIERQLRRAGKGYVLGAHATDQFSSWIEKPEVARTAEQIAKALSSEAWQRPSAGNGTKGGRLYDRAYVELADLMADEYNEDLRGLWTRGLLIRRTISDRDLAFLLAKETKLETVTTSEVAPMNGVAVLLNGRIFVSMPRWQD